MTIASILLSFSLVSMICCSNVLTKNSESNPVEPLPTPTHSTTVPKIIVENQDWEESYHEALRLWAADEKILAIEQLKIVIRLGHDDKEIFRRLADWYSAVEQYPDQESALRELLKKDPKDARAHLTLAKLLIDHLGKLDEGISTAKDAKKLYEKESLSYACDKIIGEAYDQLGNRRKALEHYKLFLKGSSFAPESDDFKKIKQRVKELNGT